MVCRKEAIAKTIHPKYILWELLPYQHQHFIVVSACIILPEVAAQYSLAGWSQLYISFFFFSIHPAPNRIMFSIGAQMYKLKSWFNFCDMAGSICGQHPWSRIPCKVWLMVSWHLRVFFFVCCCCFILVGTKWPQNDRSSADICRESALPSRPDRE